MRLGIFGGTFNPIHKGHIEASIRFYDTARLDKMLVIPNGEPPHKTESLADSAHRLSMAKIAYGDAGVVNGRCIEVSDIELSSSGKSYTVNTLNFLKRDYPDSEFYMYLGGDAYLRVEKWYMGTEILKMCHMFTVARDETQKRDIEALARHYKEKYGCESMIMDYQPKKVSSADIRNAIKEEYRGNIETFGDFTKKHLTEGVYGYIMKNSLYLNDDE